MAVADGFHVDTSGNLWLGSNRETFDSTTQSEAKFYVAADGTMVAKAGATFAGNLSAAGGTFSGNLSAAGGTFTGTLSGVDGTFSGTISGTQISGGTISGTTISGDTISGGTINGTTINAGTITTGELNLSNLTVSGSMSADRISGGTIDAGYFTGSAGFSNLTAASLGITGAIVATSSGTFGSFLRSGSYISADSYLQGTQVRDEDSSTLIDFGSTQVDMKPNGSLKARFTTVQMTTYDDIRPSPDNTYDLGSSTARFDDVFASNGTIQTSDINLKENIETTNLGLDFINDLTPIEFTWKDGGVRTHLGFSAQDVKQKLIDAKGDSQNYAVYTQGSYETQYEENEDGDFVEVSEPVERYGLRTSELVPVLTKAIQELSAKNDELESRLAALEG